MTRQDLLVKNYKKLKGNGKDYILELLQKLVKIHCGRGLPENIAPIRSFKGKT
jgi:hypothetical protein